MFEIEFPTKRISRINNVSKIKKTAATGYLYMIRPSYLGYREPNSVVLRNYQDSQATL